MSDISEKVAKALFAKSNVSTLVDPAGNGKLTGIWESKAPKGRNFPYGVFQRQAPGAIGYNFGPARSHEDDLWTLKVLADDSVSSTKSPQRVAEELAILWVSTLGTSLTLTGNEVAWMAKFADLPPLEEAQGDRWIFHRGVTMRIVVE